MIVHESILEVTHGIECLSLRIETLKTETTMKMLLWCLSTQVGLAVVVDVTVLQLAVVSYSNFLLVLFLKTLTNSLSSLRESSASSNAVVLLPICRWTLDLATSATRSNDFNSNA